jgi:hypothetical protein
MKARCLRVANPLLICLQRTPSHSGQRQIAVACACATRFGGEVGFHVRSRANLIWLKLHAIRIPELDEARADG